jgi:hypothetical protein
VHRYIESSRDLKVKILDTKRLSVEKETFLSFHTGNGVGQSHEKSMGAKVDQFKTLVIEKPTVHPSLVTCHYSDFSII